VTGGRRAGVPRGRADGDGSSTRTPSDKENEDAIAFGRKVGLGCFTTFVGFWSGGMIAVLVGKIIEGARKSPACTGLPLCNWHIYAGIGAVVGAISLPALVLWRMRRPKAPPNS
jgi:hypothetical protein